MRTISNRFHVEHDQIIKNTNGEVLPENEPLFLMRARDHLALPTLRLYRQLCVEDGCNDYLLTLLDEMIIQFEAFAFKHPEQMKQPGITRGR